MNILIIFLIIFLLLIILNKLTREFYNNKHIYNSFFNGINSKCLSFDKGSNEIQGCMYMGKNKLKIINEFPKILLTSVLIHPNPKKILLIGLGIGILVRTINYLLPNTQLDVVEIDKEMLEVSKKEFNLNPNKNTNIIIDDGVQFIKNKKNIYDVVIIDVYSPKGELKIFNKTKVIKNLYNILKKGGIVTYNIVGLYINPILNNYSKFFNNIMRLDGDKSGNRILIGMKDINYDINEINKWKVQLKKLGIDVRWLLERLIN